MKFIIGKKIAMTQVFKDDGTVVPVTAVLAQPNSVIQLKTFENDDYTAVQLGAFPAKKLKKPQAGRLDGLEQLKIFREFRIPESELSNLKKGAKITVKTFQEGDSVKVTGISKGRGFQGVVKRHGFSGSPASHGHKDQLRMPGSIGATDPARVFKGTKMPGRMGGRQVTVSGLKIEKIDEQDNILYITGALPGARNSLVLISGPGEIIPIEEKDLKTNSQPAEPLEKTGERKSAEEKGPVESREKQEKPAEAEKVLEKTPAAEEKSKISG